MSPTVHQTVPQANLHRTAEKAIVFLRVCSVPGSVSGLDAPSLFNLHQPHHEVGITIILTLQKETERGIVT